MDVPVPQMPGYVSCPGGYLAPALADCPFVPTQQRRTAADPVPHGGGGGGRRSGLLGLGIGGIL